MTKIKLVNGTILNISDIDLVNGILKITTSELTVEELATLFSDKENTNLITLMTESEIESGYQTGFTSFAGIKYNSDGTKTVELFQPVDATETRLSSAEGKANQAISETEGLTEATNKAIANTEELAKTVNALLGVEV